MPRYDCPKCGVEVFTHDDSNIKCPNCKDTYLAGANPYEKRDIKLKQIEIPFPPAVQDQVVFASGQAADPLAATVMSYYTQAFKIWTDRQKKYGPSNIAATGALGCYVRSNDKLARLGEVYIKGRGTDATDETIRDTWLDLANYAIMGLMCHEGKWPGVR